MGVPFLGFMVRVIIKIGEYIEIYLLIIYHKIIYLITPYTRGRVFPAILVMRNHKRITRIYKKVTPI